MPERHYCGIHNLTFDGPDCPKCNVVVISSRQSGKTFALAQHRVRKVAKGATINGTYRLPVGEALDAFRSDLLLIVGGE